MKTTIMLLLFAISINVSAQERKLRQTFFYDVEKGTKTSEQLTVDGKSFDVYVDGDAAFVVSQSKSGKIYPVWIGTKTEDTFEGKPVYRYSNGVHCIYELHKGYPTPVYLTKYK